MQIFSMMADGPPPAAAAANRLTEELLSQMATGDTRALEQLYAQTKTAVYGFALSILRSPESAEDVMQETYVRLFAAAGAYEARGKPMAWILTIVRNLSLMKLREAKNTAVPIDEQSIPGSGDFTESSLDRMALRGALAALADEERQIVMLHSVSGLKHREIADVLELPLSTVLSKYHRALPKLRKIIKEAAE